MQNKNDFNQDNSIDPSFLPKDSNLYVRTMNSDINNLKSQGGEALPYAQEPINAPTPQAPQIDPVPQVPPDTAAIPAPDQAYPLPQNNMPSSLDNSFSPTTNTPEPAIPDFSNINSPAVDQAAPAPESSFPKNNMPSFENPTSETIAQNEASGFPVPDIAAGNVMPVEQNSFSAPETNSLPENLPAVPDYSKMSIPANDEASLGGTLNENISAPIPAMPQDTLPDLQTDNLSSDLNNLITPEGFSPISNIDPNQPKTEEKNKLMMPLVVLGILALIIAAYLILRPTFFKPSSSLDTLSNNASLLAPAVTTPTTRPNPFLMVKNTFTQSNIDIDISKSPEVMRQITEEAKTLGETQSFKVLTPRIKDQFLSSREVLNALVDNVPAVLENNIDTSYLLYTYYGEFKPALGLVLTINPAEKEQVKKTFLTWEVNRDIIKNTLNFWLFSPNASRATLFKDIDVLGANVRYFDYPENEVAFSYAFYENFLIITTSIESVNSALVHIQNGNTPVIR